MWGEGFVGGKGEEGLYKSTYNTTIGEGDTLNQSRQSSCTLFVCECVYLLKTALSFFASTVSRIVSLPAPVVMVSLVTVSPVADFFFPSSSSLSELLEEELSDATSGAFLATHTLHTHAAESEGKEII